MNDNIVVLGEKEFEKVYVSGHIYNFSPRAIYMYLHILVLVDNPYEKDNVLDDVATKLLGYKCVWPKSNVFKVADLTLKYNGLHQITFSNWLPTKHVTTISRDFATVLYDIGIGVPMQLGQLFFDFIVSYRYRQNENQKLPFPSLIFWLLGS